MASNKRVVTTILPGTLVDRLDQASNQVGRTKSWIVREALRDWLAEQQRRHELTLEALASVDRGQFYTQEEIDAMFEKRRQERVSSRE